MPRSQAHHNQKRQTQGPGNGCVSGGLRPATKRRSPIEPGAGVSRLAETQTIPRGSRQSPGCPHGQLSSGQTGAAQAASGQGRIPGAQGLRPDVLVRAGRRWRLRKASPAWWPGACITGAWESAASPPPVRGWSPSSLCHGWLFCMRNGPSVSPRQCRLYML